MTAMALVPERAVVHSDSRLSTRPEIVQHELMHALSVDIWGAPKEYVCLEGLATLAYGTAICGYAFDSMTHYLLESGRLPTPRDLADRFGDYDEITRYMAGASFLQMIASRYGWGGVKTMWRHGLERGAERLGSDLDQLDSEWRNLIQEASPIGDDDWEALQNDCHHPDRSANGLHE